jgi:hypothetical protein
LTDKCAASTPPAAIQALHYSQQRVVIVQVSARVAAAVSKSCYAAFHIPPPLQKSTLNKTPNFKQQKKRREDQQKKRNEEKQRQQVARKSGTLQPEKT